MLTALSLAAALTMPVQDPPAPPAHPQVQTRIMVMGGPGGEGHGTLDKDGDGQITRDEFSAPLNDAFGRLDTNNDGRLSDEEMKAGHHGGGPGGDGNMVFMRHGGPEGPGGPGVHRFELRTEAGESGEERVRVFTRGENGEMTEVEGGVEGMNLPAGAHTRMLPGGGERVTVVTRGGEGGEMRMHPMPGGHPGGHPGGDARVMVFEMAGGPGEHGPGERGPSEYGPGEHRVEVRHMGPGGAMGHGAPHIEMHRVGGPDGHGATMDKDGDGRVTEEEFLAPLREAFQRMDVDRSGALEASENSGDRRVHVVRSEDHHAD